MISLVDAGNAFASCLAKAFAARPVRHDLVLESARTIGISEKDAVLEIGCGSGETAVRLYREIGCSVTGIDCSEENICQARLLAEEEVNHGHLRFMVADASNLPFSDDEFDVIISEAAFSLLSNKEGAAKEYYRVLKQGGKLIIIDFVARGNIPDDLREKVRFIPCFAGVESGEKYCDLFERYGFRKVSFTDFSPKLLKIAFWIVQSLGQIRHASPKHLQAQVSSFEANKTNRSSADSTEFVDACREFLGEAKLGYMRIIMEKPTNGRR